MFKASDRVRETSTTVGVGTYTLLGAPANFDSFSSLGNLTYTPYLAIDDAGAGWEMGIGRVLTGPDRVERTTILGSSNADAAVNWAAGTRKLRCAMSGVLAFPRYLSKDVAGGAGTTVLTQDEQRRQVIKLTGVLTGNRVIEVDDTPWAAIYDNATTGAFSLTVRVTGQTGVAVPQGRRAALYCDGVDVRGAAGIPGASSEFAAGTPIVFVQTTAPTGWTKSATHNDKALRVVSGTAGSGGATGFTSVFGAGKLTGVKTLAVSETPAHTHGPSPVYTSSGGAGTDNSGAANSFQAAGSAGGGGPHDHTLSLDLAYVDVIVATKD